MEYVDPHDSGLGEDDSNPSSLHPDSFDHEHISKLEDFSQDLQKAIVNSFPRPSTSYTAVHVLLLRWTDDDLNVQVELSSLKAVLENQYHFATEQWNIPSSSPTRALQTKLYDFQNSHQSEDELLIVYYGGHGDADRRRGRSIWAANRKSDSPTLTWSSLQHLLENAIPHVLIILDCCYAANAARDTSEGATKEILAACGRENPTLGIGVKSFTSALIEELQDFGSQPFTIAMLHSRLITMRWRLEFTPVYALLSEHGGHSIELAPQPVPAPAAQSLDGDNPELEEDMMDISAPEARIATDTRVLLSVSISGDATCDIAEWKEWLTHKAPRVITKMEVKVEAVYKSHSTMLMTSLPIVAWDCLPDKAAYRFIGFVKSQNMDRIHPYNEKDRQHLAETTSEQHRHLLRVEKQMQFLESKMMSTIEKMVKNKRAIDVDELYTLRLQANQQLKALELMKTSESLGEFQVQDSSIQGQVEVPVPETRKKRLTAAQEEFTAGASNVCTPDRSSGRLRQFTLGRFLNAMLHLFKHSPSSISLSAIRKSRLVTQVEPQENGSFPYLKPGMMAGRGHARSPTPNIAPSGQQGSTESGGLLSFETPAPLHLGKAKQSQKIFDRTLGPESWKSQATVTTSYVDVEQATSRSDQNRPPGETESSPPNLPGEALGRSLVSEGNIFAFHFSCSHCYHYQTHGTPLDRDSRNPIEIDLRCEKCKHWVLKVVSTAQHCIQSTATSKIRRKQPQKTILRPAANKRRHDSGEKQETGPWFAEKHPLTFLVAIHNKCYREIFEREIYRLGYTDIRIAYSHEAAVHIVASLRDSSGEPINIVVVVDPALPTIGGYEAARSILALDHQKRRGQVTSTGNHEGDHDTKTRPKIMVVGFSGVVSHLQREHANAVGMKAIITPNDIHHLASLLVDYRTGHQIEEWPDTDAESFTSDSAYYGSGTRMAAR